MFSLNVKEKTVSRFAAWTMLTSLNLDEKTM